MNRKHFEKAIVSLTDLKNEDGYVECYIDNTLSGVPKDSYYQDLMQGSGKELYSKFNAIYSSSALAVNNFSIVKENRKNYEIFNHQEFSSAQFERQFATGLGGTPPNLDFTLENDNSVIAFESKYLELLESKEAKFSDSYNSNKLNYLTPFWFELIKNYKGRKGYLDVAQLIKHSIGLLNYKREHPGKDVILTYIYWIPTNHEDYEVYSVHSKELDEFSSLMEKQEDICFEHLTYRDLWRISAVAPLFREHFNNVAARYDIEVPL